MKSCGKCGIDHPLSEYGLYPSGTVKPYCRACVAQYQREHRKARKKQPDYAPDCTEMRHPDDMVHEGNVLKAMKKVADEEAKIKQAHLKFIPEAGLCDMILKG